MAALVYEGLMNPSAQATATISTGDGTLLSLNRHGRSDAGSAVILCHGFIQNARSWHVPSRSLIEALTSDGHAVYAVNLRGRDFGERAVAARLTHDLKDLVDEDGVAIVDAVAARHRRIAWVGHSMGGLIGASLPADTAQKLRALSVIGTPLTPGRARLRRRRLMRAMILFGRTMGNRGVPFDGRRYGLGFLAGQRLMDHPISAYTPLPLWRPGSLSAADLQHTLTTAFDTDSHHVFADLIDMIVSGGARAGRLPLRERLALSTAPLLAIGGTSDALAPADTVEALMRQTSSSSKRFIAVDAGHIDLLIGEAAPTTVWTPLRDFLRTQLR